jgi:hypothetical protein
VKWLKLRNLTGVAVVLCLGFTIWARPQAASVGGTPTTHAETTTTVGAPTDAMQTEEACAGDFGDAFKACWTGRFEAVAARDGVAAALLSVQETGRSNTGVNSNCHDFNHKLGRWAYNDTRDVVEALTHDDRACQYGFMHGVLEAFAMDATDDEMRTNLEKVCEPRRATVKTPGLERDLGECLHGIGHAAAVHTQDDVFKALEWCRLGTNTIHEIGSCTGGVLMEYGNSAIKKHGGNGPLAEAHGPGDSSIPDDVAMKLCTMVKDEFRRECWRRAGMFWGALKVAPTEMLRICVADARSDLDQCGAGVGDWVMRLSYENVRDLNEVPQYIADACAAEKSVEGWCLYGAVFPITGNAIWSNTDPAEWMNLCDLAKSPDAKKTCRLGELRGIRAFPDVEGRIELGLARGYTKVELTSVES